MFSVFNLACVLLVAGDVLVAAAPSLRRRDLNAFVTAERAVALDGILANLGAGGALDHGAAAGLVIASPSVVSFSFLLSVCLGVVFVRGW